MGCGTSLCSTAQQNEIFEIAAKEMLRLCIEQTCSSMDNIDQMILCLPPEVEKARQLSSQLREVSATAKNHLALGVGGVGAASSLSQSMSDGVLSGFQIGAEEKTLFGHAAAFVDKAAEFVGAGVGVVAEKALLIAAAGLDQAVKDLEGPFSFAGRAWVWQSKVDVIKVYLKKVDELKLRNPVDLIRGAAPYGPAQYKECPHDCLSLELLRCCAKDLEELFLPLATDTIAKHKAVEVWDSLMWKYDQARSRLKDYVSSESFQKAHSGTDSAALIASLDESPIPFDIHRFIVGQTIHQLATVMGEQERILRLAPSGKSSKPVTFNLCFSQDLDGHLTLGKRLPLQCYKRRNM
mmetsp:Transcript_78455/g.123644  ORF Transcript_78455/g.123644 Transcript_78455/m.123644 type:complete len:351 (+) Transcript_78455:30-1082(+)